MPVHLEKREGKWRLVEPGGHIARRKGGKPIDGGGHKDKKKATAQLRAVNSNL